MLLENFEVISKLGSGKYASVYRVKRIEDGKQFALKRVGLDRMNSKSKNHALNETKLLQKIKHKNIIELEDYCQDHSNGHLCLILQLAKSDLAHKITHQFEPVKEQFIWQMINQISCGLEYLHSHNILHRDLKPTNILLLEDNTAKISDFNVSTTIQQLNYTRTGTLSYASPEIWKGETYDTKADIWSLGCLLYQLAALKRPFDAQNVEDLSKKILKCNYPKICGPYSKELKDLIGFMIQTNPRLRPSAKTIHKISSQHCQKEGQPSRMARLQSLSPFLERTTTETSMQSNFSCLENLKEAPEITPSRNHKKMVSILRRSSNNYRKPEIDEQKHTTSNLKDRHRAYKRLGGAPLSNSHKAQCRNQNIQEATKTIKFLPKRLQKLAQPRRKTEG